MATTTTQVIKLYDRKPSLRRVQALTPQSKAEQVRFLIKTTTNKSTVTAVVTLIISFERR